jgi:RNA polymerase sigma factor (sigma-70 family)
VALDAVFRDQWGRVLATLAGQLGDIELAEEATAEAFAVAAERWPRDGEPTNPVGWLITTARNRAIDQLRRQQVLVGKTKLLARELETGQAGQTGPGQPEAFMDDAATIADERLELIFTCCHPALATEAQVALTLRTLGGLSTDEIALAFLVPFDTMSKRLTRAKNKIRDARIPFAVPTRQDMPTRLPAVLEAIYGAYAIDWMLASGESVRESLSAEALYLASTLAVLLEDEPEAFGLAALIAFSLSRANARIVDGAYVPLAEQDTDRWDVGLIARGEAWLRRAHSLDSIGPFQLEAAIQSAHCARAATGSTDWATLRTLHEALVRLAPTLGSRVALAATIGQIDGPHAGLGALDGIADSGVEHFQPAWATRAHLLAAAGRRTDAAHAYAKALSLTTDPVIREYLRAKAADAPPAAAT